MPRKSSGRKSRRKAARKPRLTARSADRHRLYEIAVQCPEADVRFLSRVFYNHYGRQPVSLMEDFCGTALLCRSWVESRRGRTAVGVDLDAEVLDWARRNNVEPLGGRAGRVSLRCEDVAGVTSPRVDVRVGFNFSYSLLITRKAVLRYFRAARRSLNPEGLFAIDLHGGPEAQEELEERKKMPGFSYIWEQGPLNPIDQINECHIHFEFPDGSRMRRAFSYRWRLFGMMELRDMLLEAGFRATEVYWEGTDRETGEGDGVYRRTRKAENDPSWLAYIVALP